MAKSKVADFLAATAPQDHKLDISGFGSVILRELTSAEFSTYVDMAKNKNESDVRSFLIAKSLRYDDSDADLIFAVDDDNDIDSQMEIVRDGVGNKVQGVLIDKILDINMPKDLHSKNSESSQG